MDTKVVKEKENCSFTFGGLGGSALHALALGNVHMVTRALASAPEATVRGIAVVGVGGVVGPEGVRRMRAAGASVVGCASALGWDGVGVFEKLAEGLKS
jgi:dihydroorotate dehydrogenase (fumarate)